MTRFEFEAQRGKCVTGRKSCVCMIRSRNTESGAIIGFRAVEGLGAGGFRMDAGCPVTCWTHFYLQEDLALPETGPALSAHVDSLRRYAYALADNREDADDLVQECLTRAIAKQRPWSQIRNTRAYLFSILHNVHVDRLSGQQRAGRAVSLELVENVLRLTRDPGRRASCAGSRNAHCACFPRIIAGSCCWLDWRG